MDQRSESGKGDVAVRHGPAVRRHGGRMARFGGVGLINTLTDFLIYAALVFAGLAPALANAASFFAANAQSYAINGYVTFRDPGEKAQYSVGGYLRFLAAHAASLAISTAVILAFADAYGAYLVKAAAIVFTFVWNYFASAFLVFRRKGASGEGRP